MVIIGIVIIESTVETVTSSDDSISLPPYLAAKRPRLVAVGRAWMRVQTTITSTRKWRSERSRKVTSGPTISWIAAVRMRRHFFESVLRLA